MPVYLVTDSVTAVRTMVEASRPAGALSALIDNRFDVSPALDATDALKLITQGVAYLAGADVEVLPTDASDFSEVGEEPGLPDPPAPERPSLEAFAAAADAEDFAQTPIGWTDEVAADDVAQTEPHPWDAALKTKEDAE